MSDPGHAEVTALYLDGIAAIEHITAAFDDGCWAAPACGDWSAADTVRHLGGVIQWYREWLERALGGEANAPFSPREFPERNDAGVRSRQSASGPEAVATFAADARSYLESATPEWDRPYGFPRGTITVGLHLGVAATEWHVHAWDLTAGSAKRHTPARAELLFRAAGTAMAVAQGGVRGRLSGFVVPLAARRNPWPTLLAQSGRTTPP